MIIFYRLLTSVKGPTNFHTRFAKIFKFSTWWIYESTPRILWHSIGAPRMSQVPLLATHQVLFWLHPQQVVGQCYWRYRCPGILEFRWRWQWWGWPKWACCVRNIEEAYSAGSLVVSFEKKYFVTVWPFFSQVMIVNIPKSIPTHTYPKVLSTTKNIITSPQPHTTPNLSILHKPISFLPSSHSALKS